MTTFAKKIALMSIVESQYQQHLKYVEQFSNFSTYIIHQANSNSKDLADIAEAGCKFVENKPDEEKRMFVRQLEDIHFFFSYCLPFIMIWMYININRKDDFLEGLFEAEDNTYIPDIDELFSILMGIETSLREKIISKLPYKEFNEIRSALNKNDKQSFASIVNNSSYDFRQFAGAVYRFFNFYEIYKLFLNFDSDKDATPYLWYIKDQMTRSSNPSVNKIGKSAIKVSEISHHIGNEKDFVDFLQPFSSYVQELNTIVYRIISEYMDNPTTGYIEEETKILDLVIKDMPTLTIETKGSDPIEVEDQTKKQSNPSSVQVIGQCPLTKNQLARLSQELSDTRPPYLNDKDKNNFMYIFNGESTNEPNFDSRIEWYGNTASLAYLIDKIWNFSTLPSGCANVIAERFEFHDGKKKTTTIIKAKTFNSIKYDARLKAEKNKGGIDHISRIDAIMKKIKTSD